MKKIIELGIIVIIFVFDINIAMANEYEYEPLISFSSSAAECVKFNIGGTDPNWVNLEIKDPETKIFFSSFFQKENNSTKWELKLSESDGYFCNLKGVFEKAQNEWVKEEKTFFAKIGYENYFGKIRHSEKIGIITNSLKSRMSCDENKIVIIPVGVVISVPIANNGEAKGWTNCLLEKRKSNWDEIGMCTNLSWSPIKAMTNLNIGISAKSQLFNPKIYLTNLRQRNELGAQVGYDSKFISPYFIYQQVWGSPKKEFFSHVEIVGSKIAVGKIQSNLSCSRNYESGIKTIQYSTKYPAFSGKINLSMKVQSVDWLGKKDKQITISYLFRGIDREEEYGKTVFYNDPINMGQASKLIPEFNDAKKTVNTPRKVCEMMKNISYKQSLGDPTTVYEEKKGNCWSQSNLFSHILAKNGYETYILYYSYLGSSNGHAFSVFKDGPYWQIFEYGETWITNVPSSIQIEMAAKRILVAYLSTEGVRRAIQPNSGEWISFFWQKSTEKDFYDSMADGVNWGTPFQFKKISISPQRPHGLKDMDNEDWW
ncbi:transglutaminase-like domain-containing protein [Patescibacteria group bacterium]|nr:transglutaminase-like domain-containing protein [Patescibacteria group bacterium]MBU0879188.1 transglutaminase-like domain-containing protein [Patescibacteria group bacterium]MBU0880084.1 transglutaminase-like domain-containing protein [Patescibacteria group bacterium]MBU0897663.1 transglutaminase-like domain-containing protein [Patescibacteria group bacterium]MBU1062960.1 transglutaminase-like domain-containing protein [Patescibacteria group bacterium]